MWSEDADKKIKQAADNYSPGANPAAWDKMEAMLDLHLPQKKKRRRFLWLILLFLSAGLGTYFILQQEIKKEQPVAVAPANNIPPLQAPPRNPVKSNELPVADQGITNKENKVSNTITETPEARNGQPSVSLLKKQPALLPKRSAQNTQPSPGRNSNNINKPIKPVAIQTYNDDGNAAAPGQPKQESLTAGDTISVMTTASTQAEDTLVIISADSAKDSAAEKNESIPAVKKPGRRLPLGITLSAGPDMSSIGFSKTGTVKMQYGIGLSYDISSRLTLRTGFYISRKIYAADSADYHPPYNFWSYYPRLDRIDANCLVYEIPVNLVYHFDRIKKHNWFISAGLSSYLMKEETYGYAYKNALDQPRYHSRSYKNENNHLFSVLSLSGGYQYHFSNRFSLLAEPYFKTPLAGIGFGKVKLNNAGLLFTISLKPFIKN